MTEIISHSFEAGRRGKPDEIESGIAHLIGAYCLKINKDSRFDLRVSGTHRRDMPLIRVSGEVSDYVLANKNIQSNIEKIILNHYNKIHQTKLLAPEIKIDFNLNPQSHSLATNDSAGDSGNPIAVAYQKSPNQLPWERYISVAIRDIIDDIYYHQGAVPKAIAQASKIKQLQGLRADGKVSVETCYLNAQPTAITKITLAVEHDKSLTLKDLRQSLNQIIIAYLGQLNQKYHLNLNHPKIIINGAGPWHQGGWQADEGSREAKPYRDGFGSYGVQEDSFSGEDPTKPSATGTFLARYIAVQIVTNGLADFARVALSYAIGHDDVGLNITTNNTGKLPQKKLEKIIKDQIPLNINDAIKKFNLKNPQIYKQIVKDSDYFQNSKLPWNQKIILKNKF